jgi:hypothetical protein
MQNAYLVLISSHVVRLRVPKPQNVHERLIIFLWWVDRVPEQDKAREQDGSEGMQVHDDADGTYPLHAAASDFGTPPAMVNHGMMKENLDDDFFSTEGGRAQREDPNDISTSSAGKRRFDDEDLAGQRPLKRSNDEREAMEDGQTWSMTEEPPKSHRVVAHATLDLRCHYDGDISEYNGAEIQNDASPCSESINAGTDDEKKQHFSRGIVAEETSSSSRLLGLAERHGDHGSDIDMSMNDMMTKSSSDTRQDSMLPEAIAQEHVHCADDQNDEELVRVYIVHRSRGCSVCMCVQ